MFGVTEVQRGSWRSGVLQSTTTSRWLVTLGVTTPTCAVFLVGARLLAGSLRASVR